MFEIKRPTNKHKGYHAHVYFDLESLEFATRLCEQSRDHFNLRMGRVHQKKVGPHSMWSCQITFSHKDFDRFVPWIDENREDLSVLVHGLSGDNLADHTEHAYWLGTPRTLDITMFQA